MTAQIAAAGEFPDLARQSCPILVLRDDNRVFVAVEANACHYWDGPDIGSWLSVVVIGSGADGEVALSVGRTRFRRLRGSDSGKCSNQGSREKHSQEGERSLAK